MSGALPRIRRFGPLRPWSRPGTRVPIELDLEAPAAAAVRCRVELVDLDTVVDAVERTVRLPVGRSRRTVRLALPARAPRGYGLRLMLERPDGKRRLAEAAVEALDGWWQAPRHAAITDFRSPARTARAVAALRDWHVTVVQDYDWMYRHYRYEPPHGDHFVDTLGRRVSLEAVRAGIRAGRRVGIATLAYGSVYGAEREYVDAHPDERLFDDAGTPLSLGETFYINDLRPGRPWRRRLLAEYARACRRFGFDGIHMDTYGPPHRGVTADGEAVEFRRLYPGLIEEGAATVARARPGGRVLFNCVEGHPLEDVARSSAAALYLELWPPDDRYRDLVDWVERARAAGEGRAVVIAAYVSALRALEQDPAGRTGAVEAAVLLTSVLAAAGAHHHVLAEGDRLLVEGYYPEARPLRPAEAAELRAAWRFAARHVHLLTGPEVRPLPLGDVIVTDVDGRPLPTAAEPCAGRIWLRATEGPDGVRLLHLVDLLEQDDDRWDAPRRAAVRRTGWRVAWAGAREPRGLSPWTAGGAAARLGIAGSAQPGAAGPASWALPPFRRWLVLADPRAREATLA